MILNRYTDNPTRHRVLKDFVDSKLYELTLNDSISNKTVTVELSERIGATFLERGTLISMNVLIEIFASKGPQRSGVSCPSCACELPTLTEGEERVFWCARIAI